ncbi:MAG: hypothetical protein NTW38_10470 [Candidatus Aminicenantes bacterium]|nr:hypothetical protein [Candidatus Aminicenantes bacterium]
MNVGVIGILVIFAVFIVLIATNPRLSCFGKKLKSPFYPLFRKKRMEEEARLLRKERLRNIKTEDYGFKLDDSDGTSLPPVSDEVRKKAEKTEDYGLKLD